MLLLAHRGAHGSPAAPAAPREHRPGIPGRRRPAGPMASSSTSAGPPTARSPCIHDPTCLTAAGSQAILRAELPAGYRCWPRRSTPAPGWSSSTWRSRTRRSSPVSTRPTRSAARWRRRWRAEQESWSSSFNLATLDAVPRGGSGHADRVADAPRLRPAATRRPRRRPTATGAQSAPTRRRPARWWARPRRRGLLVVTWTVNDGGRLAELAAIGVDVAHQRSARSGRPLSWSPAISDRPDLAVVGTR